MNDANRLWSVLLLSAITSVASAAGGPYDIDWYTVAGGGGASSGTELDVDCTLGQAATATMTGGGYEMTGGFWVIEGGGAAPCPADLDGSGTIDFGDLLAVLNAWGPCPDCPEDLDGDDEVAFGDLLIVLGEWGACP